MSQPDQFMHTRETFLLRKGKLVLFFAGYHYPESEWAVLAEHIENSGQPTKNIGHISLQAEGDITLCEVEQSLLNIARLHGAHLVRIDSIQHMKSLNSDTRKSAFPVYIRACLQRLEL